jgi:cell division protein FtsL
MNATEIDALKYSDIQHRLKNVCLVLISLYCITLGLYAMLIVYLCYITRNAIDKEEYARIIKKHRDKHHIFYLTLIVLGASNTVYSYIKTG